MTADLTTPTATVVDTGRRHGTFHPLKVAAVEPLTDDAVAITFDVPDDLREDYAFEPGQHLTLRTEVAGEEVRRNYSICAPATTGTLRVAVKRLAGGAFSGFATQTLRAGDTVDVMTPTGRFVPRLDPAHAKHYCAIAAGSGITPVLSLIKTTLKREPRSRFTLLYGNRRLASAMFLEELEDLKDRYLTRFTLYNLFSREHQEVELFNGRLDAAKVRAFAETLLPVETVDEAFVCGPGAMLDDVAAALHELGLAAGRVHLERFGVPGAAPSHHVEAEDAAHAQVTIIADGVRRDVEFHQSDASILDAALRSGLDLPYSCKGGMCCTCRAKLVEGRAEMTTNYSLEPWEIERGFILTCQAVPKSERLVLDYDQM